MHNLLRTKRENLDYFNFERCGDVIVSVQDNTCALFCKFCSDIFFNLLDFLRHLQQQHNDILKFSVPHNVYSVEELLNTNTEDDPEEDVQQQSVEESCVSEVLSADILGALKDFDVECEVDENVKKVDIATNKELKLNMGPKPVENSENKPKLNAKDNLEQSLKGAAELAVQLADEVRTDVADIANGLRQEAELLPEDERHSDKENINQLSPITKTVCLKNNNIGMKSQAKAMPMQNLSNRQPMTEWKANEVAFGGQKHMDSNLSTGLLSQTNKLHKSVTEPDNILLNKTHKIGNAAATPAADASDATKRVWRQRGHYFDFQQPMLKTPKTRYDPKSYAILRATHKTKELHRRTNQLKKRIFKALSKGYMKSVNNAEPLKITGVEVLPNLTPKSIAKFTKLPIAAENPQQEESASNETEIEDRCANESGIKSAEESSQTTAPLPAIIKKPKSAQVTPKKTAIKNQRLTKKSVMIESKYCKALSNPAYNFKTPLSDAHLAESARSRGDDIKRQIATSKEPKANFITFTRPSPAENGPIQDNSKVEGIPKVNANAGIKRPVSPAPAAAKYAKPSAVLSRENAADSASNSLEGMQLELSDSAVAFLQADLRLSKLNVDSILNGNLSTCSATTSHEDAAADENMLENILAEVQSEACAAQRTTKTPAAAVSSDGEPAQVVILKDAQLLNMVGLDIIQEPEIELQLSKEKLEAAQVLAKKFSQLLKKYTNIWQTKSCSEAKTPKEICQQEFALLMADANAEFNVNFSIHDVKRLFNVLSTWFSRQWDLRMLDRNFISEACEYVLQLFSFMPKFVRRRYFCEYCVEHFFGEGKYATHRQFHTDVKAFKCTLCPKSFNGKGQLARHQRTHN